MNHVQDQSTTQPNQVEREAPAVIAPEDQARHFAAIHSADAGQGMIDTIRGIKKRAKWLTVLALSASMPHQVSFLIMLCLPYTNWDGWHAVESAGMLLIAVAFPVASDFIIVSSIETISTVVASDASRWRAFGALQVPLGFSATVNFLAPGPPLLKILAATLVGYIVISEVLKFVKPNFRKLNVEVTAALKEVEEVKEVQPRRRAKNRKERVIQVLADNPQMKAVEVAKRAGVSANYVYSIRREAKAEA
jgi:hypothetical protein